MSLVGIIDLGSNSVRLIVYEIKEPAKNTKEASGDSAFVNKKKYFHSVMDAKKIAGLSAYVNSEGEFSSDGVECAITVLQKHIKAANNIGCTDIHIFATAVIRNCSNSKAVVKKITKAVGLPIDVLSDEDEAHLGFIGATCDREIKHGTLIDIGGGSTELTSIKDSVDAVDLSIPQGCVSSYAEFVRMILPLPEEEVAIKEAFLDKLSQIKDLDKFKTDALYGIGGSVRAIDKMYATAFTKDVRLNTLELYQISALQNLLTDQPSKFAHAAAKAVPERMHSATPGLIITRTLMEELGAETLTVCKYGVREGYLLERVLGV